MRDPDGVQVPRHCAFLLFPWFTPPLSTAHQFGFCSTHTRLIDSILNDVLRNITGCLRPTPTKDLPVLAGIQPAELRQLGAKLSLANGAIHDPDQVLHGQLVGQQDAHPGRLRSRRPFVPASWKLFGSLPKLDIRVK